MPYHASVATAGSTKPEEAVSSVACVFPGTNFKHTSLMSFSVSHRASVSMWAEDHSEGVERKHLTAGPV